DAEISCFQLLFNSTISNTICLSTSQLEKTRMYQRKLQMDLPSKQSAFLWGARQTGKSSYLASHYPQSIYYDLLDTHEMLRLAKKPSLLREEILALEKNHLKHPIIIDEVQKVPELLNEVHWLRAKIAIFNLLFLLTIASAALATNA